MTIKLPKKYHFDIPDDVDQTLFRTKDLWLVSVLLSQGHPIYDVIEIKNNKANVRQDFTVKEFVFDDGYFDEDQNYHDLREDIRRYELREFRVEPYLLFSNMRSAKGWFSTKQ